MLNQLYDPFASRVPTRLIVAIIFVVSFLFGSISGSLAGAIYKSTQQSAVERLCYAGLRVARGRTEMCLRTVDDAATAPRASQAGAP